MPIVSVRQAFRLVNRLFLSETVICLTYFRFLTRVQYVREGDMIYCRAIVDTIDRPSPHGLGLYRVEVLGREPNDWCRTYEISARDENYAAKEGMDKFIEEIGKLIDEQELK